MNGDPARLIVAITGATGVRYGVKALELLQALPDVQSHLIVSASAALTLRQEEGLDLRSVTALADVVHQRTNIGASIASGSYPTLGMLVAPCSIKTLSAIANSYSSGLIARAADVTLKEGRPLVLLVRETPLHVGHLQLMTAAAECGAIIAPPVPAFYTHPESIDDLVEHTVARALVRIGVPDDLVARRWEGLEKPVSER